MTDQQKQQSIQASPNQGKGHTLPEKVTKTSIFLIACVIFAGMLVALVVLLLINCFVIGDSDSIKACIATVKANGINLVNLFEGAVALTGLTLTAVGLRFFAARLKDQQKQTETQTRALQDQENQTHLQTRALQNQEEQTRLQTRALQNEERQTEIQAAQTEIQERQVAMQERQEKIQAAQADIQTAQAEKATSDRFSSAVAMLGNSETSARTGAVYSLYHLAIDEEKYRQQIAKILCGHIRSQTQGKNYRAAHSAGPSSDVQTAIDVLFKGIGEAEGLYAKFFDVLPQADLSRSYLVGADFVSAMCQKVTFWRANCQGAFFKNAQCQGANFTGALCQRADFVAAQCQGAHFWNSLCQGAFFNHAQCRGAFFKNAQCQGAGFENTNFQGAYALANEDHIPLSQRIGEPTKLETMIVSGKLSDESIASIEDAPEKMPPGWHERMNAIMEKHAALPIKSAAEQPPAGIDVGVLEDSPELQEIIKRTEKKG